MIDVNTEGDGRPAAERIENMVFSSDDAILNELAKDGIKEQDVLFYPLTDFMDECNDQNIQSMESHWLTYVHVK